MPFRYHETVNIYDTEAMARYIRTQETQFTVLQGKISALITDSELQTLRAGGSTMYSRMTSVEATAEGLTSQVSALQTNLTNNYSTTEAMNSAITQKATEITTSVSNTLKNYSTTSQMNTAIEQKANSITQSVTSTVTGIEGRLKKAEQKITDDAIISTVTSSSGATAMVSAINQTADTIKISAAHINLVGAVTANDIAAGAITTEKLAAGAITTDKLGAGAVTADKIQAGTITGSQIQAGSISAASLDIASIFAQDVTATGTIRGANLVGATAQIENGSIGGWTISNGQLIYPIYPNEPLDGDIMHWLRESVGNAIESLNSLSSNVSTNTNNITNLTNTINNGDFSNIDIVCTSLTASDFVWANTLTCNTLNISSLTVSSLNVTGGGASTVIDHAISCVELTASGNIVSSANITGSDLYTQTSNAGTGSNAVITGTGRVAPTSASSRRYKNDKGLVGISQAREVLHIPVVNFQYKPGYLTKGDEKEGVTLPGFFAEDVERCIPEAVYHNKDGKVENWMERIMLPLMLRVMQDQQHRIEELERKR